jgi:hypothetical protein
MGALNPASWGARPPPCQVLTTMHESATMARTRKRKPFEYHLSESERTALAEVPDYVKRTPGLGIGNITADDIHWLTRGKDGELAVHLPEQGYEQYSPLDLALLGIIRANSKPEKQRDSNKSDRQRLSWGPRCMRRAS